MGGNAFAAEIANADKGADADPLLVGGNAFAAEIVNAGAGTDADPPLVGGNAFAAHKNPAPPTTGGAHTCMLPSRTALP